MKLKRTVTIEFDRVKITTSCSRKQHQFCAVCRAESEFINQTEAVQLLKILQMQGLFVKPENLHFYQPDAGHVLVCLNSIINHGNHPAIFLTNGDI